ncbi:MAG: GatB/YqeY domain-containing protein [Candidatus Harrisonbacteria bacterium]|nr:GatB/YqeY domain-containing protein [Candidatus Harrisonbacteria bacterium]
MLKEKITADIKEAMKSGNAEKVSVLRMLSSAIGNRKIEQRTKTGKDEELTDDEVMEVIGKEAKKRKESIVSFEAGGRADLAAEEKKELEILSVYLPAQMSEEDVRAAILRIVAASPSKALGPVMKAAMAELKGRADGALVGKIVKEKLG